MENSTHLGNHRRRQLVRIPNQEQLSHAMLQRYETVKFCGLGGLRNQHAASLRLGSTLVHGHDHIMYHHYILLG